MSATRLKEHRPRCPHAPARSIGTTCVLLSLLRQKCRLAFRNRSMTTSGSSWHRPVSGGVFLRGPSPRGRPAPPAAGRTVPVSWNPLVMSPAATLDGGVGGQHGQRMLLDHVVEVGQRHRQRHRQRNPERDHREAGHRVSCAPLVGRTTTYTPQSPSPRRQLVCRQPSTPSPSMYRAIDFGDRICPDPARRHRVAEKTQIVTTGESPVGADADSVRETHVGRRQDAFSARRRHAGSCAPGSSGRGVPAMARVRARDSRRPAQLLA